MNGAELAQIILKEEGIGENHYEIKVGRSRVVYNKINSQIHLKTEVLEGTGLEHLLISAHEVSHLLNNETNFKTYHFFKIIKYMYGTALVFVGLNIVLYFFGLFSLSLTIFLNILLILITPIMVGLYKKDERDADKRAINYIQKYSNHKNDLATLMKEREANLILVLMMEY
ncbi:hypothetical protein CA600_06430 [Paenibacillus sp. VTT E-133280]|uniref:zinc metallopeptidase n=1 Tax=Paenibacillus sp. VTT E-133280 TaxID=1986222 RepID=UPI000BA04E33|nr:zinc metallopeptidase [Paenibacillus sp. VTT E-133280]OZQ68444.1 hypothetical protein CA600_06430 [Paenibacillus sp. VTT E-133280]